MSSERLLWIGQDPASQRLFELAQRIAPVATPVLITGERGTGKNHLARLVHELGPRRDAPYLKIGCASLPGELAEAELFGYERGGFAGANERKLGAFELAQKGTVVLDEVAALSLAVQEKLARVLEDGEFERLGGKETVRVESRLIALTNADLGTAVQEKRFRDDLYQRLNLGKIWMAPLRERATDVLPLAEHFLGTIRRKHGKGHLQLAEKTKAILQAYKWAGNVSELQYVLERAVISGASEAIEPDNFSAELQAAGSQNGHAKLRALEEVEREAIVATLEATDYQIGRSAHILGISRKTLLEKRKKFGLR